MRRRGANRVGTLAAIILAAWTGAALAADPLDKLWAPIPGAPAVGSGQQALSSGSGSSSSDNPDTNGPPSTNSCYKPTTTEPISIVRGAVLRHEEDIEIPCPLIDLVFHRDYMSDVKYTGPLGPIWQHSYDWQLYQVWVTNYSEFPPKGYKYVVLRALADYRDLSLGELLEGVVLHALENKAPFSKDTLKVIAQLKDVYGLDLTSADAAGLRD